MAQVSGSWSFKCGFWEVVDHTGWAAACVHARACTSTGTGASPAYIYPLAVSVALPSGEKQSYCLWLGKVFGHHR